MSQIQTVNHGQLEFVRFTNCLVFDTSKNTLIEISLENRNYSNLIKMFQKLRIIAYIFLLKRQSISLLFKISVPSLMHRSSVVLGKFMPLHKGHLHLVNAAVSKSRLTTIMVCSLTREPIPGHLRYQWMKQSFPQQNVVHVTDDTLPQQPHEHPDFWNIWTNLIKKCVPKADQLDCIFSSEPYGKKLGDFLKIKHEDVDIQRKTVPISGTKIREKPMTNWDFLSEPAKPYFVKKVVVMGPESAGKTTLCQKLSRYFNTNWVDQYGRQLSEHKQLVAQDFPKIVLRQLQKEEECVKSSNRVLFCDTQVLTTKIFLDMYFPQHAQTYSQFFKEHTVLGRYCLYILVKPTTPPVQDGTRRYLDKRMQHYQNIKAHLQQHRLPFVVVEGTYDQIFQQAKLYTKTLVFDRF